jgi:uncharacterized LabA/DUF88 family protein
MLNSTVNSLYIFIDASNLWQAQKAKGRFLDYQKIVIHIQKMYFVYSSKNHVSQELRTGADGYVDVLALQEDIWGRVNSSI